MVDVSIIGAGVVGLCVANELLTRNVKVRIFDKRRRRDHMLAPGGQAECWHHFVSPKALKRQSVALVKRPPQGGRNEQVL